MEKRESWYRIESELREVGYVSHAEETPAGGRVLVSLRNSPKVFVGLVEITNLNDDSKFNEKWVVRSYRENEGQLIKGSIMGLRKEYNADVERKLDVPK
jgi:hypothetical protein